ncbi:MAG: type II secretion system minor pseudopilin GspK [Desulfuromonadales bacterium]|jgi:general secretion pathway protein K|nr:type II secretion system minor pseudopilin GspK [Desulfuromonadales bacterium]
MSDRRGNRGMALLLVLVIVALLTSLLTDLAFSTMVDLRLTETFRDSTRAYYLAKGGINAGRMILQADRNKYDSLDEMWSKGVINYPVGEGNVTIFIEDLDGKLAINGLVNGNNPQAIMVDRFYRLLVDMELDALADPAELTAALIDWLDSGDEPYVEIHTDGQSLPVSGAEDLFYRTQPQAYRCKNGPLETLQELSLVKGFTPEIVKRISPYLAVNGTLQVNVNTASAEVLMALDLQIGRDTAQAIIDYRQAAPIETIAQLEAILAPQDYIVLKTLANLEQLGVASRNYRVEASALVNDGSRRLVAEVDKQSNKLLFFKVN